MESTLNLTESPSTILLFHGRMAWGGHMDSLKSHPDLPPHALRFYALWAGGLRAVFYPRQTPHAGHPTPDTYGGHMKEFMPKEIA
jgi:hypothetical protein